MNKCPYCGSEKTQGVSGLHQSLHTDKWDIEQLTACLSCGEEFVTVYKFSKNIKLENSTVFENEKDNSL